MAHTTQQQFMHTIREALGRKQPLSQPPVPPVVDDSLVRFASVMDDLPTMFAERAKAVGMFVRRTTSSGLPTQLLDVLREIEARMVTLSIDRLTELKPILSDAIQKTGIELREWRGDRSMANQYSADAGITDVHAALAETGTLVCNSDANHCRGGSLVPAVHIAIVRKRDIVPDMLDYMASLDGIAPADLPSAQAFITGPSKTADIEGILITGVHGPGRVFILLVEDA